MKCANSQACWCCCCCCCCCSAAAAAAAAAAATAAAAAAATAVTAAAAAAAAAASLREHLCPTVCVRLSTCVGVSRGLSRHFVCCIRLLLLDSVLFKCYSKHPLTSPFLKQTYLCPLHVHVTVMLYP